MSSRVTLCTQRFEQVRAYYEGLGGRVVDAWDRDGARGNILELHGLRLELLDAEREREPLALGDPHDRVHLVFEVPDVSVYGTPEKTSWAARIVRDRDPDGIPVTFIESK